MNKVLIRNQQEIALPDHTHRPNRQTNTITNTQTLYSQNSSACYLDSEKNIKMSYVSRAYSIKMISISVHLRIWLEARRRNGALI